MPRFIVFAFMGSVMAFLSACVEGGGVQGNLTGTGGASRPITENYVQIAKIEERQVTVDSAGRPVIAVAPDGFCIPRDAIQSGDGVVFVLMDRCSGNAGTPGVLSLSITSAAPPDLAALEAHLLSGKGLAALGYGGPLKDVALLETWLEPDALYAVVTDRSKAGPPFAGDLIVRAFVPLNGRLSVATLISLKKGNEGAEDMRAALREAVLALRAANPDGEPAPRLAARVDRETAAISRR